MNGVFSHIVYNLTNSWNVNLKGGQQVMKVVIVYNLTNSWNVNLNSTGKMSITELWYII